MEEERIMKKYWQKTTAFLVEYGNYYVIGLAILCLYAILQIKLGLAFYLGSSEDAGSWNQIIEGLSYSYLAGYFFYFLTVRLPYWEMKIKVREALKRKAEKIDSNYKECLISVLPPGSQVKFEMKEEIVVAIFKEFSYLGKCRLSSFGVEATAIEYIKAKHEENQRLATTLLEYKPWLSADAITQIEEIRNSDLSSIVIALTNPKLAKILDSEDSRATLAGTMWKMASLAKEIKETI